MSSCVRRKVCIPSRAAGAGMGGRGTCAAPCMWGGGYPQDPLRVSAGRDEEEEQGDAQARLPEDLPSVVGATCPGEEGG